MALSYESDSVLPTVAGSILLRGVFFALCRTYVQRVLVADLQQVASDDLALAGRGSYELLEQASTPGLSRSSTKRAGYLSDSDALPSNRDRGSRTAEAESSTRWASLLASITFCSTFSESCTLCTLVLTANITGERARWLNWTISTTALLSIILVIVPLLQSFMLVKGKRGFSLPILGLTLILFAFYELAFNQSGIWLSKLVNIEAGSHKFGYINDALRQICVPGVLLIAGLSGAGAVNTAWNAYEWRALFKGTPVTETAITHVEQSLKRAREDKTEREAELQTASTAAEPSNRPSFLSRIISSDPASAKVAALKAEIAGLESLESQLLSDLQSMRDRRKTLELSGTFKGRSLAILGYLFTCYCVARVLLSAISLLLGFDKAPTSSVEASERHTVLPRLFAGIISAIGLDVDVTTWSRLIGLGLIGVIILVNMRVVLSSVSRLFKMASASGGAPFMLLFLSQLMAIYLLTSLISLPDSGDSGSQELLRTLPDFAVFTRLFDAVFVAAACSAAAYRYLRQKIRAEDITSASIV